MGLGFTIDTPLKVSRFGMDSVISLCDDSLIERIRKMYCGKYQIPYKEITEKIEDFRAKRITAYLDLISDLASRKFEELRNATQETRAELMEYFDMLPDSSTVKQEFKRLSEKYLNISDLGDWLKKNLSMGSIDVNIMTKVDKDNYKGNEKLPVEYNDAHAALRGFANSELKSSIIFSAGMNPRLYSYIAQFDDFFPDKSGFIKKKIVLKVSDYRSALIQGRFLAKKGLWVSEYRVESGLNCGGHAFATEGYLMGPILAEFRDHRKELIQTVYDVLVQGLESLGRVVPDEILPVKVTAQGGVGTAREHEFLLDHYQLDSIGWGTPFLLVPEVTAVDPSTLEILEKAKEEDLYLSNTSPLGVPFNTLKGNTKDIEKFTFIEKGRPGSSCPKKYLALSREFQEKGICTASRQYQHLKLKELENENLPREQYELKFNKIVEKSCLCVGLGTSALLVNDLDTKVEGEGVSVCPGPNLAYFSERMSLKQITDHIYGRANMISRTDRPNMFVKELNMYLDYLKERVGEAKISFDEKQQKYLLSFAENLREGIGYYQGLYNNLKEKFEESGKDILNGLQKGNDVLKGLLGDIKKLGEKSFAS